jgi:hypothetical protein
MAAESFSFANDGTRFDCPAKSRVKHERISVRGWGRRNGQDNAGRMVKGVAVSNVAQSSLPEIHL